MKAENRIISKFDYFSFRLLSDPLVGCYLFEILRRQRDFSISSLCATSSICDFSHTTFHELIPNEFQKSASFDIDRSEKSILN